MKVQVGRRKRRWRWAWARHPPRIAIAADVIDATVTVPITRGRSGGEVAIVVIICYVFDGGTPGRGPHVDGKDNGVSRDL